RVSPQTVTRADRPSDGYLYRQGNGGGGNWGYSWCDLCNRAEGPDTIIGCERTFLNMVYSLRPKHYCHSVRVIKTTALREQSPNSSLRISGRLTLWRSCPDSVKPSSMKGESTILSIACCKENRPATISRTKDRLAPKNKIRPNEARSCAGARFCMAMARAGAPTEVRVPMMPEAMPARIMFRLEARMRKPQ